MHLPFLRKVFGSDQRGPLASTTTLSKPCASSATHTQQKDDHTSPPLITSWRFRQNVCTRVRVVLTHASVIFFVSFVDSFHPPSSGSCACGTLLFGI